MIIDLDIKSFLDELASKAPTPGGGSAAAVMGATGAALASMVCNLTIGKEKYAAVEAQMRVALERCERLRERLLGMVTEDARVFDSVMTAYGMARGTDAEKAARNDAIQAALKQATDVPLACARACAEVIALTRDVAAKGNKGVISDAGVAVLAAHAARRSAALNVYINVGNIKDGQFTAARMDELERLLAQNGIATEEIYQLVRERI
ncbi:MAG: cyclodeaminase/cyclohydrolase family protein [Gammaproteobacteria bacterium]|nr:cyclodeaminase/cyclohydrolase family protein [Gammaproteobacteria bacterium]